jgi:hypothetical protein
MVWLQPSQGIWCGGGASTGSIFSEHSKHPGVHMAKVWKTNWLGKDERVTSKRNTARGLLFHCPWANRSSAGRRTFLRYSVDFQLSRRFTVPRRGVRFPSRAELLGAITSHGPSRESYTPLRKERGPRAETACPSAAGPAVLAQGMRAALSPRKCATALLQQRVSGSGAGVVGVESSAEVPGHGGWQTKAERTKPALPEARQRAKTA